MKCDSCGEKFLACPGPNGKCAIAALQAERDRLAHRLDIIDLPGGEPGEGGWSSTSRSRQRIGAVLDKIDRGVPDDDILDAVAEMLDKAAAERDELRAEKERLRKELADVRK